MKDPIEEPLGVTKASGNAVAQHDDNTAKDDLDPEELEGTLSFDTVETGEFFSLPLRMCLTNLFQHQIHHRGQTHHMLGHAGLEPPPLDVVQFGSGL